MEWLELAGCTNFSFLRGASHPDEMVLAAKAAGHAGLAVADHNTVAGVVRAHVAAREAGLRLMPGSRLVLRDGLTLVALPHDRPAWGRLTTLLSLGNRRAPKGECHLDAADLVTAAQGLTLIALAPDDHADADFVRGLGQLAGSLDRSLSPLALGLDRRFAGADLARLAGLDTLARELSLPAVAVGNPLMHAADRRALADVLTCIREGTTLDAAGRQVAAHAERHIKPVAEMVRLFRGFEHAIRAQQDLAAPLRFDLAELAYEYPEEVVTPGETSAQTLRRLALEGAARRHPEGLPEPVRAMLEHELGLIAQMDYEKYFLTVHDIVRFARSRGILCQGRGSAANSVVCWCLGITAVDPTRIDLLFERFVSPERREPPDIDVDFEHERREEVIQYIYTRYGRERAAIAATVITYRGRSAVRDVGKAIGLSADTVDALVRTLWGWSSGGPQDTHVRDELGLDPDAPRLRLTLELTRTLIGFPRHLSQHVGGFVITRSPLEAVVPIGNAAMPDRTFVEWDKDDLDALGILKIDVLALGMLTCVSRALELIGRHHGRPMGLADIPPEDPRVYDMICAADTMGVFQIESRAQMQMLPRLQPRTFYDLVIEVAIVRPGPIQGDMVHPYLRRRRGEEPVEFPSEELRAVLGKTLGVPLFQEQAMRIAIVAAGFSPAEADRLRRAMATFRKVGIIHQFGLRLVDGMVARGYDRDFAERCFRQIEGFGEYGFPESHAASFALIVYASCWLKHHYPDAFLAAILNAQPMGFYAPAQLVRDARDHGVTVREADVNHSDWDCTLEPDPAPGSRWHAVRLGLRQITGFPEAAAARIAAGRAGGPYRDLEDLMRRARLTPALVHRLADADAVRSLTLDRRAAGWAARRLVQEELPLFAHAARRTDRPERTTGASEYGPEPDFTLPQMGLAEHVAHDYATLRLSLKAHPMAFLRTPETLGGALALEGLKTIQGGRRVAVAGLVLVRQRPGTASGVIFMTLEDETGTANIIVWPKVFERFRPVVLGGRVLEVHGRVQREGMVVHVIAERLVDRSGFLGHLLDEGSDPLGAIEAGFEGARARADEVARGGQDPRARSEQKAQERSVRARVLLPPSRDFH
jgi:error-prone DNA polymerase